MSPRRPSLQWDEVVEYTFLSNFDLLRDARQDVSKRSWATPTGRLALDTYFKRRRAEEDIVRLNIEIRRLLTYMGDEDSYVRACEDALTTQSPALAYQVSLYRSTRARFNMDHLRTLQAISRLRGFSGILSPGKSMQSGPGESASTPQPRIPPSALSMPLPESVTVMDNPGDTLEELEVEEDEEDDVAAAADALRTVIEVAYDTQAGDCLDSETTD